jgi:hypothetical protein
VLIGKLEIRRCLANLWPEPLQVYGRCDLKQNGQEDAGNPHAINLDWRGGNHKQKEGGGVAPPPSSARRRSLATFGRLVYRSGTAADRRADQRALLTADDRADTRA